MTFVVIATWIAQEGNEATVAHAIESMVGPTRAEPGCLAYLVHRDLDNPRAFLLYEEYVDRAAYEAHGVSDHFQRYAVETGIPLLESRRRSFYEPLEPAESERG